MEWRADLLGLLVTQARGHTDFAPRDGVPPDPAPLLTTWLTASGHRLRRDAFADGGTVEGMSFDEAYRRASANMAELPFEVESLPRTKGMQVRAQHAASLLAAPEALLRFEDKVEGDLLAIVPKADTLILAGSGQDDLALLFAFAMVENVDANLRGLSPVPYRITATEDGAAHVERWEPESDSPLRPLASRARQLELERRYGPMLQYDDIGTYVFREEKAACASPRWSYDESRSLLRSYAVWMPGMFPTLLPPVDWIAVNLKGPRAAPQLWLTVDELAACAGVEVARTSEFGLPVDVVAWSGREDDRDGVALRATLRDAGARTTAAMGGAGEQVHILDWVPSRMPGRGSRFTAIGEFPQMQLS